MDSRTKGIVKGAMVLYHAKYFWTYNGEQTWTLRDEYGEEIYQVRKDCFPPQGHTAIDFVKKSVLLLPDIYAGENFDIIFSLHQTMSGLHSDDYCTRVRALQTYDCLADYSSEVINQSLACIFGEA